MNQGSAPRFVAIGLTILAVLALAGFGLVGLTGSVYARVVSARGTPPMTPHSAALQVPVQVVQIFVCPDGETKSRKEDCPLPQKVAAAPSPQPVPTDAFAPAAPQDAIEMLGHTVEDVPGVQLVSGTTVTSILTQDGRHLDLYAIGAKSGQAIDISMPGDFLLDSFDPSTTTIYGNPGFQQRCFGGYCRTSFRATATGTYYLLVLLNEKKSSQGGQRYTLRVDVV